MESHSSRFNAKKRSGSIAKKSSGKTKKAHASGTKKRQSSSGDKTGSFRFSPNRRKRTGTTGRGGLLKHKKSTDPLNEVEQKMAAHEMAIAAELQENLLPRRIPRIEPYDIKAYYKPCQDVGGDYYDFIEINEDHLGILVADVSGKGIPGSMVMTETRTLIRCEGKRTSSPMETLKMVNRFLYPDIKRGMFVSAFYAVLQPKTGLLTFTSAGHNPMVLWRKESNTVSIANTDGMALGIDRGPLFDKNIREEQVQLFHGDRFILYTDGMTEAMNEDRKEFGTMAFYHKVREIGAKSSSEFVTLLVKAMEEHQGKAPQHDDVTIVTGQYKTADLITHISDID